ncbi:MAG: hypothetical protein HPY71_04380 [Firmicutes bacterium]|nr:hypothetical protein [Bacillota bacterium]
MSRGKQDVLSRFGKGIILFDGAMGTMLLAAGFPPGECPERWNVDHPEKVKGIHEMYREVGAMVLETNTFGGNRKKLDRFELGDRVREFNIAGARLAREVAGESLLVAGSMGPTGEFMEPLGSLTRGLAFEIFSEQARALEEGGADIICIETMSDLDEAQVALDAAKASTHLPVMCLMTFEASGRTIMGVSPGDAARVLSTRGAIALGANCSSGPGDMIRVVREMATVTGLPIAAIPNAGLPQLVDGATVYSEQPESMAESMMKLIEAGASIIGGCCGTTPEHIRAMASRMSRYGDRA